jgi:hypothetical protein
MTSDGLDREPPDLGCVRIIDPFDPMLHFLEDPLSRAKIEAVRPFDDQASFESDSPIRIVESENGEKFIMQGNHRIYAAREDAVRHVTVKLYTPQQWWDSFEYEFKRDGNNNPMISP